MRWPTQGELYAGPLLVCFALAGCASTESTSSPEAAKADLNSSAAYDRVPNPPPVPEPAEPTVSETLPPPDDEEHEMPFALKKQGDKLRQEGSSLVDVAVQPIHDLNLIERVIPPVLIAAKKQGPYAVPAKMDCASILAEIKALDAALGPDLDAPSVPGVDPSFTEKATDRALDYVVQPAVNSVRATVNYLFDGVMPFRSWVRKLSGAEQASAEVAAAIGAGATRRPFIKGWFRGAGCVMPPPPPPRVRKSHVAAVAPVAASAPPVEAAPNAEGSAPAAVPTPAPEAVTPAPPPKSSE